MEVNTKKDKKVKKTIKKYYNLRRSEEDAARTQPLRGTVYE